jgi:hypothetical protein
MQQATFFSRSKQVAMADKADQPEEGDSSSPDSSDPDPSTPRTPDPDRPLDQRLDDSVLKAPPLLQDFFNAYRPRRDPDKPLNLSEELKDMLQDLPLEWRLEVRRIVAAQTAMEFQGRLKRLHDEYPDLFAGFLDELKADDEEFQRWRHRPEDDGPAPEEPREPSELGRRLHELWDKLSPETRAEIKKARQGYDEPLPPLPPSEEPTPYDDFARSLMKLPLELLKELAGAVQQHVKFRAKLSALRYQYPDYFRGFLDDLWTNPAEFDRWHSQGRLQ